MFIESDFYYIVVDINGKRLFIAKDMSYTDNFSNVMKFNFNKDAEDFIIGHNLHEKNAIIIKRIGVKNLKE